MVFNGAVVSRQRRSRLAAGAVFLSSQSLSHIHASRTQLPRFAVKIAVLSDVHANLAALEAVLGDIREEGADRVYNLGDVIGYGPDPRACLERVRDFPVNLMGNHEEAVLIGAIGFNPKAKQAIDSFFVRAGDVLSAVLVFVGTTYLAMQASHFALFNIALVVLWLVLTVWIGRAYKRLVASGRPPCQ
jgi:hypothetical protein